MNSSSSLATSCSFKTDLDLAKWVDSLRKFIENDQEEASNTDVCIFTVPKILLDTDPDSYIPQQVALGPYHQWRQHVYDMQKYKLAAAKKEQKQRNVKFERIVELIKKNDEARIRASYHKFLDIDGHALAWMMAVDMTFLLEFLQVYYMREEGQKLELVSRLSSVVDVSGKKLSHMTILRDVIKLENQIPLFLVKTMLEHQNTEKGAKETLQIMLMGLYRELSPFQYRHQSPNVDVDECDHILDFLYHMTIPNPKELGIVDNFTETGGETTNCDQSMSKVSETTIHVGDNEAEGENAGGKERLSKKPSNVKGFLDQIWRIIKKTCSGFIKFVKIVMFSRAVILVLKLPWKIISSLPILKLLKGPIENMLANFQGNAKEILDAESNESKPPLIEEITIPSVTEMVNAGIRFIPVKGTISAIRFKKRTSTLYLPVVHLDVNTEVYLRNLVAYEACVASGPLVMARYTELMNGIIDTEEDAKYLMDHKIVLNHLKSDQEAADLWNGMSKCVKMTKVPHMDQVIEEVNKRKSAPTTRGVKKPHRYRPGTVALRNLKILLLMLPLRNQRSRLENVYDEREEREYLKWHKGGGMFHKAATIDPTALIGFGAVVHSGSLVAGNVRVRSATVVSPNVTIGQSAKIGYDVALANCTIGDTCGIHNEVCIGQDGFGFYLDDQCAMVKKPQG